MTVCIAGICGLAEGRPSIVLCTDWLVSGDLGSSERMFKHRLVGKGIILLPAGEESEILAIIRHVRTEIRERKPAIEDDVLVAIRHALSARKKEMVEEYVQANFAISYQELLDQGRTKLPDGIFRQAMVDIQNIRTDVEFIVAGFWQQFPFLIQGTSDFKARIVEECVTIGSGSPLAMTSLLHRQYIDVMPLNTALYLIWEAKKYAERVGSVGKKTAMRVLRPGDNSAAISVDTVLALDKLFLQFGPQPLPDNMELPAKLLDQ
jgi:20S proteasome alpha/beta subunit